MKVSVISPSIRAGGLDIVKQCLDKQTLKAFEWIVGTNYPFDGATKNVGTTPKTKKLYWTLNRDYNKLLRECRGDIVVSWQDLIWAPVDALERFYYWYKEKGPKWCVTGVGDLYAKLDELNKPIISVWSDPRKSGKEKHGDTYECYPVDWEVNFCSAPLKSYQDIGGFDEELDNLGFGMDNVSLCERMDDLEYRFWIDQSLECRGIKHPRHRDWDKYHTMHGAYSARKEQLKEERIWPTLSYLKPQQKKS